MRLAGVPFETWLELKFFYKYVYSEIYRRFIW